METPCRFKSCHPHQEEPPVDICISAGGFIFAGDRSYSWKRAGGFVLPKIGITSGDGRCFFTLPEKGRWLLL